MRGAARGPAWLPRLGACVVLLACGTALVAAADREIEVRLVAPDGGVVTDARPFVFGRGGVRRKGVSYWAGKLHVPDEAGDFAEVEFLEPRTRGGKSWQLAPVVLDAAALRAGIDHPVPTAKTVRGTLRTERGEPVTSGVVVAVPARWLPHEAAIPPLIFREGHHVADLQEDGGFFLRGLAAETYELRLHVPRRYAADPVTFTPGPDPLSVVVRERALPTTNLVVRVADGRPAPGVEVRVEREDPGLGRIERLVGTTDAAGAVAFEGLDPSARYRLQATPPAALLDARARVVDAWTPASGTTTLPRGEVIRGRFVPAPGLHGPRSVTLRSRREDVPSAQVAEDGSFAFGQLRPGVYDVGWAPSSGAFVRAGATDVVLPLRGPTSVTLRVEGGTTSERTVLWARCDGPRVAHWTQGSDLFRFVGWEEGRPHTVVFLADGEGRSAVLTDVVASPDARVVTLAAGRRVAGRVEPPEGTSDLEIRAWPTSCPAISLPLDTPLRDGRFEIFDLPRGDWTVGVTGFVGEREVADAKPVRDGEEVRLVPTPRD